MRTTRQTQLYRRKLVFFKMRPTRLFRTSMKPSGPNKTLVHESKSRTSPIKKTTKKTLSSWTFFLKKKGKKSLLLILSIDRIGSVVSDASDVEKKNNFWVFFSFSLRPLTQISRAPTARDFTRKIKYDKENRK